MTYRLISAIIAFMPLLASAVEVASPNGNIKVSFDTPGGVPTYTMDYSGKTVIKPSTLGIELADAPNLMDGFEIKLKDLQF